jgi:Flp pilus assembly pilin Flp
LRPAQAESKHDHFHLALSRHSRRALHGDVSRGAHSMSDIIPDTKEFQQLCLRSFEEAEREIALIREQARLVKLEVELIEAAIEDDPRAHHGHNRFTHRRAYRGLTTGTVIQFSDFVKDRRATSSIEYAIIASLLSLIALVCVDGLGISLGMIFSAIAANFGGLG